MNPDVTTGKLSGDSVDAVFTGLLVAFLCQNERNRKGKGIL